MLAAKIAGLSVKINMQRLPKPCVSGTCLGSFFQETKRKYKIFSKIDATSRRAASRLCRNRAHVLLCGLEQVQEILVYLIQNSTRGLAVSCGVGSFPSIISLLLSVQTLDNAGFCCPRLVTCHSCFLHVAFCCHAISRLY